MSLLRVGNVLLQILVASAHSKLVGVGHGARREVLVLVSAEIEIVLS